MHETDERREPTEETFDEPDQRWEPAERHLPPELLPDLMWMDEVTAEGRAVQQYKHVLTRRYLNLDLAGQAWDVKIDAQTGQVTVAQRIDPSIALAHLEGRDG